MTKPITIRDNIYDILTKMKKSDRESYSDVIEDLIQKSNEFEKLSKGKEKEFWNKGIIHS